MKTELVEVHGIKMKLRFWRDWDFVKEEFFEDMYVLDDVSQNSIVIDLGAHIGTFTLRCAKLRGCEVYAYEPGSESFSLLVENVGLNGLTDRVKCFNEAVGKRYAPRKFYVEETQGSSSFYLGINPDFKDKPLKLERVQCTTLKRIFEDNGIEECDTLKMDIEGAEREVLNDESKPYFKRVRYVAIEWHNYDGHIYRDYMQQLGFKVLLTGTGIPVPAYSPTFNRGMLYAKR